ncbi:uncharacterized protein EV420DRAFT_970582 [Desarmillaria tabescens]|uniref:Uncharacterized protein n=1 Tax=Armillaria tabescens TaxID=1929756 RepID=A0AA39MT54_ARMTA|nr:uncharacterized protein EV420DRAFT_970582 [Desarmillaria tabescens]KAK0445293.1 hypothetical protein EV420DRAFT_970582 [Desarmillaria tabescens]
MQCVILPAFQFVLVLTSSLQNCCLLCSYTTQGTPEAVAYWHMHLGIDVLWFALLFVFTLVSSVKLKDPSTSLSTSTTSTPSPTTSISASDLSASICLRALLSAFSVGCWFKFPHQRTLAWMGKRFSSWISSTSTMSTLRRTLGTFYVLEPVSQLGSTSRSGSTSASGYASVFAFWSVSASGSAPIPRVVY